jgi:hypothetical protein
LQTTDDFVAILWMTDDFYDHFADSALGKEKVK